MDILQIYLRQLEGISPLSREEEQRCARRAKEGDEKAAETLILSNLKFVVSIAVKYQCFGLPLSDLINEGNIGLIKALKTYDPGRGLRFISFARWWIRHYILKALFEQTSSIRLPLRYASCVVRSSDGTDPATRALKNVYRPLSLDQLVSEDENSESIMAFVASEGYELPEERLMKSTMAELIEEAMAKLKPMEQNVIRWRYGLGGLEPLTLSEIGKRYNLTKERIRQIMHTALSKIKYPMEKREILAFVS